MVCARRVRRYWACVSINQLSTPTDQGVAFPLLAAGGAGPHIDPAYPRRVYRLQHGLNVNFFSSMTRGSRR